MRKLDIRRRVAAALRARTDMVEGRARLLPDRCVRNIEPPAWDRLGNGVAVQGNLDPVLLLGPRDVMLRQATDILTSVKGREGHIFNLGHGILPETPVDNVRALADLVHSLTERA